MNSLFPNGYALQILGESTGQINLTDFVTLLLPKNKRRDVAGEKSINPLYICPVTCQFNLPNISSSAGIPDSLLSNVEYNVKRKSQNLL